MTKMIGRIKILSLLTCAALMMSFATAIAETEVFKTGIYGVCGCEGKSESSNTIKLTINEDHSFSYYNATNPAKKIDLKGEWKSKGSSIVLENYDSDQGIHDKWRMDKNGMCVKSRNGLNFMRLCLIKDCK